jgi:ABC-2 type transport system ATP-binding protein
VVVLGRGRVITQGSVDALRARVGLTRIRCESRLDATVVAGWAQVTEARREDGRLVVTATAAEPVLRQLLDADAALAELEVRRAGLAEAFVELSRQDQEAA